MPDLLHHLEIAAPPGKVYQAVTSEAGLRAWWTPDARAEPRVGAVAEFGFFNRAVVFRMRIVELSADRRLVWDCLGDLDEWRSTRLVWDVTPHPKGSTLRFTHGGWQSASDGFAHSNTTWGGLMHVLRDYAEGKQIRPYFK
jgi:uncharacterized protein YndB with AHSA1/START domain